MITKKVRLKISGETNYFGKIKCVILFFPLPISFIMFILECSAAPDFRVERLLRALAQNIATLIWLVMWTLFTRGYTVKIADRTLSNATAFVVSIFLFCFLFLHKEHSYYHYQSKTRKSFSREQKCSQTESTISQTMPPQKQEFITNDLYF